MRKHYKLAITILNKKYSFFFIWFYRSKEPVLIERIITNTSMVATEFRKLVQEEGSVKKTIITGLAEMMGTSLLVFLGCMGCVSGLGIVPSHLQITLTFGLSVMIVIQVVIHIVCMFLLKIFVKDLILWVNLIFQSKLLIDK